MRVEVTTTTTTTSGGLGLHVRVTYPPVTPAAAAAGTVAGVVADSVAAAVAAAVHTALTEPAEPARHDTATHDTATQDGTAGYASTGRARDTGDAATGDAATGDDATGDVGVELVPVPRLEVRDPVPEHGQVQMLGGPVDDPVDGSVDRARHDTPPGRSRDRSIEVLRPQALELLDERGYSDAEVCARLGISRAQLVRWDDDRAPAATSVPAAGGGRR